MSSSDSQDDSTLKRPSHEEICQLPNTERIRWVHQIRIFYPLWSKILAEVRRCHQMQPIAAEPPCLLLVGPSGAGKTTLVKSYAQKYPAIVTKTVTLRPV